MLISIPVCIVAAIAITLVLYWLIEKVWHPFPDPIARPVYVWIGLGILGVLLGVSRVFAATRIDGRVLTVVSVLLVVVSSAAHVNLQFQSYPTLGTALGLSDAEKVSLADLDDGKDGAVPVSQWKAPADMPSVGKVSTVTIAGRSPDSAPATPRSTYRPRISPTHDRSCRCWYCLPANQARPRTGYRADVSSRPWTPTPLAFGLGSRCRRC